MTEDNKHPEFVVSFDNGSGQLLWKAAQDKDAVDCMIREAVIPEALKVYRIAPVELIPITKEKIIGWRIAQEA